MRLELRPPELAGEHAHRDHPGVARGEQVDDGVPGGKHCTHIVHSELLHRVVDQVGGRPAADDI